MARGRKSSPAEMKRRTLFWLTKVARAVNRSRKVTMNLLKELDNYGKSCERPRCLTAWDKRAVIRI